MTPLNIVLTECVSTLEHKWQQNVPLCWAVISVSSKHWRPKSQLNFKWFIALCMWLSFNWHLHLAECFGLVDHLMKNNSGKLPQTDHNKENVGEKRRVHYFSHLLVKKHSAACWDRPLSKIQQCAGIGHLSGKDRKDHPFVKENLHPWKFSKLLLLILPKQVPAGSLSCIECTTWQNTVKKSLLSSWSVSRV